MSQEDETLTSDTPEVVSIGNNGEDGLNPSVGAVAATNAPGLRTWIVLAVAVALALAAAVTFGVLAAKESSKAHDRAAALAAAKQRVPVLLSYSYRTLDEDLTRSKDQTTGQFKKDYSKLLDDAVRAAATQKKISTKADLTGAGVVSSSGSKVTVLVFLTQTTTAPDSSPSVNTSRVEVDMRRVGGTWKIVGLTPR